MQKLIIIQRMVKARSKNYYENNKERMQEKTRITKQRKRKYKTENTEQTNIKICLEKKNETKRTWIKLT